MNDDELVVQRVRHETRRRALNVVDVAWLSPGMKRIGLAGDELTGFHSPGFDDHIKLFFPDAIAADHPEARPTMRDFTPRRYDPVAGRLWIDFALHESGPATHWAACAQPGGTLTVAGPRGSALVPLGFDWHLLVADETGLPAVGRRLEELPPSARAVVVVEVEDDAERIALPSAASAEIVWVYRTGRPRGSIEPLLEAVTALAFPVGRYYAWVACESEVARALRQFLLAERGAQRGWLKAAGYWRRGVVAVHETHTD